MYGLNPVLNLIRAHPRRAVALISLLLIEPILGSGIRQNMQSILPL